MLFWSNGLHPSSIGGYQVCPNQDREGVLGDRMGRHLSKYPVI